MALPLLPSTFIAAALAAAAEASAPTGDLLALNPNVSLRDCSGGGAALTLSASSSEVIRTGTFVGSAPAGTSFSVDDSWLYCVGNYPAEAQICLTVVDAGSYIFELTDASVDPTLALVADGAGMVCDDDTAGNLMSRIEWWLEPGTYELFVGSYALGGTGAFAIRISRAPW